MQDCYLKNKDGLRVKTLAVFFLCDCLLFVQHLLTILWYYGYTPNVILPIAKSSVF